MTNPKKKTVVVLGAGPCGMTAAWELSNSGYDVILVEKDDGVGGLCRTNELNKHRFDLGGHRFITKSERLLNMVLDLMKEKLLVATRKSVILLRGKEFEYPLAVKNLFKNLDFFLFARAIFDYSLKSFNWDEEAEKSFEGWIKNRYGKTLYDLFFGPYTEKLWGMSPAEISSDWAVQRIAALNLRDVILHLFKLKKDKKRTFTKRFYYPEKGIGQMFDCIRDHIEGNGVKIHLKSKPIEITTKNEIVKSLTIDNDGDQRVIPCDFVVSTIPLNDFSALFVSEEEKLKLAETLKYRSLRFLNVLVDKEQLSPNTWMYVSEAKYFMTRIQEPKKRSPKSAPVGKTSVMLEIPCDVGDDIYTCSDKDLFERGMADLKRIGVDLTGKTGEYFTTFADHAYPIYSIDYKERIQEHLDIVEKYSNVITCGRQGLFRYIFMDTAMVMGLKAADYVMGKANYDEVYNPGLEKSLLEVKSIIEDLTTE